MKIELMGKWDILYSPFMFVGAVVQQLFNYAMSQGGGGECHAAIAKFIEDWGGVKVKSKQGG
jgi:hypothetical protein